jgi:hypothetical protein
VDVPAHQTATSHTLKSCEFLKEVIRVVAAPYSRAVSAYMEMDAHACMCT